MQRAALVALLLTAAAFSGVLAGCSGLAETGGDIAPTAPDPTFREVIAIHLKAVFKNYASYDAFEISDPRWVHSIKGWNWLTCVRFQDHGHTAGPIEVPRLDLSLEYPTTLDLRRPN